MTARFICWVKRLAPISFPTRNIKAALTLVNKPVTATRRIIWAASRDANHRKPRVQFMKTFALLHAQGRQTIVTVNFKVCFIKKSQSSLITTGQLTSCIIWNDYKISDYYYTYSWYIYIQLRSNTYPIHTFGHTDYDILIAVILGIIEVPYHLIITKFT